MSESRRVWRLAPALIVAGALVWVGWTRWAAWCFRDAMAQIDSAMAEGQFELVAHNLDLLLSQRHSDEAAYVLGNCEQARGRFQAAAAAWERVVPGSAFTALAIQARMRLFHDSGQLAAAEQLVIDAANDPRNDRTHLLVLLASIYTRIGCFDEAERLIEARWEHLSETGKVTPAQSVSLVRLHIEQTLKTPSRESLHVYLDGMGALAPGDDRVWLGRANLAIRTGAHDEAKRWLDACRLRRPDDLPVWRAWLAWGTATNRMDVVREALEHLPAAESTAAELHRLSAWLCSRRGDVGRERRELESVIAADPADVTALDRLAQLAEKEGQTARAAELHLKKAKTDRLRARYVKLYARTQPMRDAEEMAGLAEELGRGFEARVFLTLAIADEPEREDLRRELRRLNPSHAPTVAGRGETLAEAVARELEDSGPSVPN